MDGNGESASLLSRNKWEWPEWVEFVEKWIGLGCFFETRWESVVFYQKQSREGRL